MCFDKDGTLIDVHASWVPITQRRTQKIIAFYHLPQEKMADICGAMGVDLQTQKIMRGGLVGYQPRPVIIASMVDWLKGLGVSATKEELTKIFSEVDQDIQSANDFNAKALPGVVDGIKELKRSGFKISVCTSDRHKNTEQVLGLLGLSHDVDAIVGGDDVGRSKPDPEGLRKACDLVGVETAGSVYVGDTVDDMRTAKAGGSAGYGITHGLATHDELSAEASRVFDTFAALVESLIEQKDGKKTTSPV